MPVLRAEAALSRRIAAIDLLRGVIMILMALDHVRDFFSNAQVNPTDPLHSWPALFATRWVTHLCAPGFVALAGTSAYLQTLRGRRRQDIGKRLLTRGLWLMFVDATIMSFGIFFTVHFHFFQVLYAIGGSMIVLAALQFLPVPAVATYGFAVLLLHDLLGRIHPAQLGAGATACIFIVSTGFFVSNGQLFAAVLYPVLPWSGVMALGYAFGVIVAKQGALRRRWSAWMGVAALTVFAVLRTTNVYGDSVPFVRLGAAAQTTMSLLNVTKYPPSLDYLLATLGVLLLMFAVLDLALEQRWMSRVLAAVEVYGRVPFFYYVCHFYLVHLLAVGSLMAVMRTVHVDPPLPLFGGVAPQIAVGLPAVYAIWFGVVAVLYLPCRWFAGVKARRSDWWLSYV